MAVFSRAPGGLEKIASGSVSVEESANWIYLLQPIDDDQRHRIVQKSNIGSSTGTTLWVDYEGRNVDFRFAVRYGTAYWEAWK